MRKSLVKILHKKPVCALQWCQWAGFRNSGEIFEIHGEATPGTAVWSQCSSHHLSRHPTLTAQFRQYKTSLTLTKGKTSETGRRKCGWHGPTAPINHIKEEKSEMSRSLSHPYKDVDSKRFKLTKESGKPLSPAKGISPLSTSMLRNAALCCRR